MESERAQCGPRPILSDQCESDKIGRVLFTHDARLSGSGAVGAERD